MVSIVYLPLLATSNSISAQNTTNMTMSGSSSLTKMNLEEVIKALEEAASIHLNAAHQALSSLSVQAKEQFDAGMKALSTGDSNGPYAFEGCRNEALG